MARGDGDGEYFSLVRRHARYREADDLAPHPEAMNQRVALGQHGLEFAFTPATVKRRAVKLREGRHIAQRGGFDRRGAAAP